MTLKKLKTPIEKVNKKLKKKQVSKKQSKFKLLTLGLLLILVSLLAISPDSKALELLDNIKTPTPLTTSNLNTIPGVRILTVLDMPTGFDEQHSNALDQLQQILRKAKNTDFTIRLSGLGGDILMANNFIRAMEDSKRAGNTITFDVIGIAASAHAYITCGANRVIMRPGSSLLLHEAYAILGLFNEHINIRVLSNESIITSITSNIMNTCLINNRLTQQDINTIKKGDDVIILATPGKLTKQYESDKLTIIGFTVPVFLVYLSNLITNLLCISLLLSVIVWIIRRVGK